MSLADIDRAALDAARNRPVVVAKFLGNIAAAAAPVVGSIFGGPIGGAIGGAAGGLIGQAVNGQSAGQQIGGALGGAYASQQAQQDAINSAIQLQNNAAGNINTATQNALKQYQQILAGAKDPGAALTAANATYLPQVQGVSAPQIGNVYAGNGQVPGYTQAAAPMLGSAPQGGQPIAPAQYQSVLASQQQASSTPGTRVPLNYDSNAVLATMPGAASIGLHNVSPGIDEAANGNRVIMPGQPGAWSSSDALKLRNYAAAHGGNGYS